MNAFKQFKDVQTQPGSNDLNRIECRIGLTILNATQVGLIKTAAFTERDLCPALLLPQSSHTLTESHAEGLFHAADYPEIALIHILTNSYKLSF